MQWQDIPFAVLLCMYYFPREKGYEYFIFVTAQSVSVLAFCTSHPIFDGKILSSSLLPLCIPSFTSISSGTLNFHSAWVHRALKTGTINRVGADRTGVWGQWWVCTREVAESRRGDTRRWWKIWVQSPRETPLAGHQGYHFGGCCWIFMWIARKGEDYCPSDSGRWVKISKEFSTREGNLPKYKNRFTVLSVTHNYFAIESFLRCDVMLWKMDCSMRLKICDVEPTK